MIAHMMMTDFLNEIEAYLTRTDTKPSRFGREFVCDPGFVARLRRGGECKPSTIDRVRSEMAKNPNGLSPTQSCDAA